MNYLAHLFLAEDRAASRIGNLLGDFVTGRPEEIELPPEVVAGIVRHRAIDRFTDEHPAVAGARRHIRGERRRFANAILDICFDHLLATSWDDRHPRPLRQFLDGFYAEMREHRDWLPGELASNLDQRLADDWLGHYGTEVGLREVFLRVVRRRPACAAMSGAEEILQTHRAVVTAAFESLLPDLRRHLDALGPEC